MKNIPAKLISLALAASMMLSVASCANKGNGEDGSRSGKKIGNDTPWYETASVDVDVALDNSKEVEYTYPRLVGADEKYIVVLTTGYYKMPSSSDIDWDKYDYNAYAIAVISIVDRATHQTVNNIDLSDNLGTNDYIDNATYENGTITAFYTGFDMNTYATTRKEIDFDCESGAVLGSRETADVESGIEHTFDIGGYKVETAMDWSTNDAAYNIFVYSPDGSKNTVPLRETGKNYYDIPVILPIDNENVLIPVSTDAAGYSFFELNLKTLELKAKDSKEYDWVDLDSLYMPYINSEGEVYFTNSTGINKIDMKKKETVQVFNYSWCDQSRNLLSNLEIADYTGDTFILCGQDYTYNAYEVSSDSSFMIFEFSKAATNPHAGKTILELYSENGYTENNVSEAILKFNRENGKFFIEVSDRYSEVNAGMWNSDMSSEDDYQSVVLNADSKMSNQLAMDILNGEGPDILMNVSSYGQLNNKNYLADLTPFIGTLSSDKYFTNIVDAAKVDGVLYNLPVCYMINGIQTNPKYAGASGIGFTTAEYEAFLKDTLNGNDVISCGQAHYFAKLFNAMSDEFIANGKADFSGPEFAALAEFVKENVRMNAKSWDEMYAETEYGVYDPVYAVGVTTFKGDTANEVAMDTSCYGITSYFMQQAQLNGASAILGYPSSDGRGPMVQPYVSVAVSAQAYDVSACGEFVSMLMSDEVQYDFAMNDNFVLNREAFRAGAQKAVEYCNGEGGEAMFGYDRYTGEPLDNRTMFSDANINNMENIILSCSQMYSPDASINLILVEEMPAYFSGQKSLADVITIAQDRAQKVLNERG